MPPRSKPICIFVPSFGEGGVERMLANLAEGFCSHGVFVDFLTDNPESPYLNNLPPQAVIRSLKEVHEENLTKVLKKYLLDERPSWLLSAKEKANKVALTARDLSGSNVRLAFRVGTTTSIKAGRHIFPKKWIKLLQFRKLYRRADLIIAVSRGVAEDVSQITGLHTGCIAVIPNPVVNRNLYALAEMPIEHGWFQRHETPILLGAGGFRRAKDFPALIHAFAMTRERISCKLVILGRGRQEKRMKETARKLGVSEDISLPGFISNPYPFMAQADVFILSSRWEGSPNVLTEALALGTPVVSTDCESGPREILEGGRYGRLVPVGDTKGLSEAILQTLSAPPDKDHLKRASHPYEVNNSAKAYLEAMEIS